MTPKRVYYNNNIGIIIAETGTAGLKTFISGNNSNTYVRCIIAAAALKPLASVYKNLKRFGRGEFRNVYRR